MFKGTLKPYQVEAVNKMVSQKTTLVAYEMGLGKTPMTIAAIEELRDSGTVFNTVLVLCLASLKYQWQKEIAKFSDSTSIVIDGTPKIRASQYFEAANYNYLIMNYEQVVNDWVLLKGIRFDAIICDEATAIKGFRAKRAKMVKELSKRIPIRYALTGTPVENGRPEEVFSIMQFVDSSVLGRFDVFDKTFIVRNHFGGVQRYQNLSQLHSIMSDNSVRKTQKDEDVKPFLPNAIYRAPYLVKMDYQTKRVYNFIVDELKDILTEAKLLLGANFSVDAHYGQGRGAFDPLANDLMGQIMVRITALRMLCSHPELLRLSCQRFDTQVGGSSFASKLGALGWLDNLTKTPKLDGAITYLMDHLNIDDTYKAVVFSTYLTSVDLIVEGLAAKGIVAIPYTGRMNAKQKEANKLRFQIEPTARVLVSSDAGGYGVDLPQANLLLNYDQPWSSGLAVQRNGRINRTSSTWSSITIQDILMEGSIEQRQHDMLFQKKTVAGAILDGKNINLDGGVDFSIGSLIEFLSSRTT